MREGHTARRGNGREIPALIALVVWCGGFEVAPFLHVVDHDRIEAHEHGHSHGADHAHDEDDGAPDPEHGDGSLAHRGLAASTAPPALPAIDAPWIGTVRWVREIALAQPARAASRPRARAPPC